MGRTISYGIVERKQEQMIGRFGDKPAKFDNQAMYPMVCTKDANIKHVHFKKGVPKLVSGGLAGAMIADFPGIVTLYKEKEAKAKSEYEELKQTVKELQAKKTVVKEESKPKPKPKKE